MNKKAFTIPELLIFLTIVGVISVTLISIVKPNDKYLKYAYYNAYNVLATAGFNISEDRMDDIDRENQGETIPADDKVFPNTYKKLCKKLAINPTLTSASADQKYGYINTLEYNCNKSSFKATSIVPRGTQNAQFNSGTLAFTATNSMRFYITDSTATGNLAITDPTGETKLNFFIVWVDLNGDRRPNSATWTKGRPADIVPFIMSMGGVVIPVGYPTVDTRYMSARIAYPTTAVKAFSLPMAFYTAQYAAFGDNQYPVSDWLTIRSKWKTGFPGTVLDIESTYIPSPLPSMDANCVPESGAIASPCTIDVDPAKSL